MFSYLDRFNRPVGIVKTLAACAGKIIGKATAKARCYLTSMPSIIAVRSFTPWILINTRRPSAAQWFLNAYQFILEDSVAFLKSLDVFPIDLLYLDSFDLDMNYPLPSAIHHLKELVAIAPMISSETLVVVDDSPTALIAVPDGKDQFKTLGRRIAGKGQLIAEYAEAIGVKPYFVGYQCGWLGLGRARLGEISASIREEDRHNLAQQKSQTNKLEASCGKSASPPLPKRSNLILSLSTTLAILQAMNSAA